MEEQNKYYTPDIEDLYIGYECEACFTSYGGYMIFNENGTVTNHEPEDKEAAKNWSNYSIEEQSRNPMDSTQRSMDTAIMILKDNRLRTKYLDQADIESLGWIYSGYIQVTGREGIIPLYKLAVNTNNNFLFTLSLSSNNGIQIFSYRDEKGSNQLFSGECKSINELRIIMKLLKINGERNNTGDTRTDSTNS